MTAIPSSAPANPAPATAPERPAANDLFERLPVPALRTGADGRIWRVNALAAKILGSAAALEGSPIGLILPGLDLRPDISGPVLWSGPVPAPEPRSVEVSADRVASSPGAPLDWIVVIRDTTESDARRELHDDILALLAHELRTPLATLRGFAENLVDSIEGPVNERQRDVLNRMIRTARRSTRLLESVLESARCRAGRAEIAVAEFRLEDLVAGVRADLAAAASEKGVAIHAEAEEGLPPVASDADKLEQVVLNLLTNAIKYTPRNGTIRVRASRPGSGIASIVETLSGEAPFDPSKHLEIAVEDTGVGIPEEDLARIFERFSRTRGARGTGLSSFGLGLWICRDIVTRLGGRLCIQSELNVGTRVSVLVPIRCENGTAAADAKSGEEAGT